ncbi:MAG TPA: alpha/beta hydrolase [Chthoniobacterales bacterium]
MNRLALAALCAFVPLFHSGAAEPLTAAIKTDPYVYVGQPVTLDGSASTQGADVAYSWKAKGKISLQDAGKSIARFTPAQTGYNDFTLTVTRGAEQKDARAGVSALNDPKNDRSPVFDGARKVLYKEAPNVLGDPAKLYLHVFNPPDWKASDQRAAVLIFHGGAWKVGSPKDCVAECRYWASRGLVAIAAQYRIAEWQGTKPEDCVADARSAVRYVRAHAAELGIDPQKIAVGGTSAGAHIAACAGTLPAYDDPGDDRAVSCVPNALLLYFPYSMVTTAGNGRDDMSPLHFVGGATPPTLFIGGELDAIAPAVRGIEWAEKVKGLKNPFRLFIYRNTRHGVGQPGMNQPGVANDVIRQTDLFLASLGFVSGEPTVPPMDAAAIEALHVDPKNLKPDSKP